MKQFKYFIKFLISIYKFEIILIEVNHINGITFSIICIDFYLSRIGERALLGVYITKKYLIIDLLFYQIEVFNNLEKND